MMAAMVGSAVVQETVSQIISGLVRRYEGKEKLNANENLERLEMAHIKLDAALETSNMWLITDVSLLCWRKKLKHAAQECGDTLHKCRQRVLEDEKMEQEVSNSSLGKQIAHATKSLIFSAFSCNDNVLSTSIVRRFEWYADGASEFLRFIEHGGTPRYHMPSDSLIKHLFSGKAVQHKIVQGSGNPLFLLWLVPFSTTGHGIEVYLILFQEDCNAPEVNFAFSLLLQLSESTDIIGSAVNCLQLYSPHFKPTVEVIKKALTQLPTKDFSWFPYSYLWQRKVWDNIHSVITQWFRPDPLCCRQYDQQKLLRTSNLDNVGLFCRPHESSEDMLPADKNSVVSGILGEKQHCLHTDITFEELKEMMLPKAIDYFHQNIKATVYQMLWKSKHFTAYIQVEKAGMETPSEWRTSRGSRKRKLVQRQYQELKGPAHEAAKCLNLWVAHAPIQLQGLILNWIKKEKQRQLAAEELHLLL
ncbi:hypothetical protein ACP70R_015182 [Stipagrostis hirtigluma subsp. patula]